MDHALAAPESLEYRSDRAGTDHPPPTKSPARLFSILEREVGRSKCGLEASAPNQYAGAGEKNLQHAGTERAGRHDKSALRRGTLPSI